MFKSFSHHLDHFWTFFFGLFLKSSLNFVTILLLFYVLSFVFFFFFWPWGMWNLTFPIRDRTQTPCTGRGSLNHCTARKSHRDYTFWLAWRCKKCDNGRYLGLERTWCNPQREREQEERDLEEEALTFPVSRFSPAQHWGRYLGVRTMSTRPLIFPL